MKLTTVFLSLLVFGAPMQCSSDPNPEHRIEDTPAEALWGLSERFRADGNADARRTTLEQLVEQYPNSREAERARLVLSGREVEPDAPAQAAPITPVATEEGPSPEQSARFVDGRESDS